MKLLIFLRNSIILSIVSGSIIAQELPPLLFFSATEFGGENQSWMIDQCPDNFIYFANNEGLLEFNGARWKLYPSPNGTIVRSVFVHNNRIYTGAFREFGYWEKNSFGTLVYNSISQKINNKLLEDEHFWGIINFNDWMLFQSARRIYIYNIHNHSFKIIDAVIEITEMTKINNTVYLISDVGLFTILEGDLVLVNNFNEIQNDIVINIFPFENDLILLTRESGFYKLRNNKIVKWNIDADDILRNVTIYCGIQLKDHGFVLGTIADGVIFISKNGELMYHLNKGNGLANNTVLSIFEDKHMNIWLGLDNGINCINLNSPVRIFNDSTGDIGTVYFSVVFDEYLYLGTNQGLFYKKFDSSDSFALIENTSGQVWNLKIIGNELFCTHHLGTFLIKKREAIKIATVPGAWNIRAVPGKPNILLQGNYSGLYILSKDDGEWRLRNKINGFGNSSRFFEIDINNDIWINHEYKGVFHIKLDENLENTLQVNLKQKSPEEGKNSGLILYNNNIIYFNKDGVFKFNYYRQHFVKDTVLSQILIDDEYISGKLVIDNSNRLWGFTKNNIVYFIPGHLTEYPQMKKIPIPHSLRKTKMGYENISQLKNGIYFLGTAEGYIIFNLPKFVENEYIIYLNSIDLISFNNETLSVDLGGKGDFSYKQNRIAFSFGVAQYDKFSNIEYQYKLNGLHNVWSNWSAENNVMFENLRPGRYTFNVRARVENKLTQNIEYFSFVINKPWYFTNLAKAVYFIFVLMIFFFSFRIYNQNYLKKYKRELEYSHLESQKQLLLFKNQQLNQDIENKNRELSILTMSIIRKNELLVEIKKELKKIADGANIKALNNLIENNINTTKDWQIFEEAFNNADKEFMQKIKKIHPELTPNDLKICAFLRLNLSSKEIAPLLNISVRSVEIKRYRLRKKLNLPHDVGLTGYLLEV